MSKEQTTIVAVRGMTCGGCARHVETALRALDGVVDAKVAVREGEARVTHDSDRTPVRALVDAIRGAGYDAVEKCEV